MTTAYPLSWPESMPRHGANKATAQFKTTLASALDNVHDELRRFGKDSGKKIEGVVISSNYSLGQPNPQDGSVAVYFSWNGIATCIAVDRYAKLCDNLQAIYHVLSAERTKLRHGGLAIVTAAMRGYAALPPPTSRAPARPWHEVLEVPASATILEAEQSYKRLRSQHHPDRPTGDAAKFDEVQRAIEAARAALRTP
jgi:DnaJ-like protein